LDVGDDGFDQIHALSRYMGGADKNDPPAVMNQVVEHLAVEFIVHRLYVTFLVAGAVPGRFELSQYIRSAGEVNS
jgi:hypothetical protein